MIRLIRLDMCRLKVVKTICTYIRMYVRMYVGLDME